MRGDYDWRGVCGWVSVEIGEVDGQWHTSSGVLLPESFRNLVDTPEHEAGDELELEFESTGYHQEMSMYGGPDNLGQEGLHYDERELKSVKFGILRITNEQCLADLQTMFQSQIDGAELDTGE